MEVNQQQFEPKKDNKKNSLLFFEVGIFEIVFVVLLLALIFGLLNYLNILNLGKAFPALSLLPRLESTNPNNTFPIPTATPAPYTHTNYPYNRDQAEKNIEEFISSILKDGYLIKDTTSTDEQNNVFSYSWILPTGEHANILYVYQNHTQNSYHTLLTLDLGTTQNSNTTEELTASTSAKYFQLNNSNSWKCSTGINFSLCEQFIKNQNFSLGYGLKEIISSKKIALFACKIPKESSIFSNATSCYQ